MYFYFSAFRTRIAQRSAAFFLKSYRARGDARGLAGNAIYNGRHAKRRKKRPLKQLLLAGKAWLAKSNTRREITPHTFGLRHKKSRQKVRLLPPKVRKIATRVRFFVILLGFGEPTPTADFRPYGKQDLLRDPTHNARRKARFGAVEPPERACDIKYDL